MNKHTKVNQLAAIASRHSAAKGVLDAALNSVLDSLPDHVSKALTAYRSKPSGSTTLGLQIQISPDFFDQLRKGSELYHPLVWTEYGQLLCDIEFYRTAPPEVAQATVARALARGYIDALGRPGPEDDDEDAVLSELMASWGFLPTELPLWFAAKLASPRRPIDMYYAYRYGRFNLIPPANADLRAVADILDSRGRPDLATQLKCRLAGMN